MTDYTNISSRAMLVGLHLSTWSARKFDKKATTQVNAAAGADADAGRYNKHLLAGSQTHKAVTEAAQAARDLHYRETLPWTDEGSRLLPTQNYFAYTEQMRAARAKFDLAVSNFLDTYPYLRSQAQAKLGALYDEKDFPAVGDVAQKFAWEIVMAPVPMRGDWRLDLPADHVEAIERASASRVEQATRAAMVDAWTRLRDAVARIHKAAGENGIVRATLIEHAQTVCDTLKRLNVAQDDALEAMRARVETELTGIAVDDLRKDDLLRHDTERRAKEILDVMGAMYAPVAA